MKLRGIVTIFVLVIASISLSFNSFAEVKDSWNYDNADAGRTNYSWNEFQNFRFRQLWSKPFYIYTSSVCCMNNLFYNSDYSNQNKKGCIVVSNLFDGIDIKKTEIPEYSQVIAVNNKDIILCGSDAYYLIDRGNLNVLWTYKTSIVSEPLLLDDESVVLMANGDYTHRIVCVKNDKLKWENSISDNWSILASYQDKIVCANHEGGVYCFDLNGKEIWNKFTDMTGFKAGDICASESNIYLSYLLNHKKNISCLDIGTGKMKWSIDNQGASHISIDKINNNVFFGNEDMLYCVVDGQIKWHTSLNSKITKMVTTRSCILASTNEKIFCVDKDLGDIKADFGNGGKILCVCQNKILVKEQLGDSTAKLVCYGLPAKIIKFKNGSKYVNVDSNDYMIPMSPVLLNKITYIPVVSFMPIFGGKMSFVDGKVEIKCLSLGLAKEMNVFYENIKLQIGNPIATLNGKQVQIDPKNPKITPIIINGRTMVSLRFLAESLGCKVDYKPDTKEIIVTYQP